MRRWNKYHFWQTELLDTSCASDSLLSLRYAQNINENYFERAKGGEIDHFGEKYLNVFLNAKAELNFMRFYMFLILDDEMTLLNSILSGWTLHSFSIMRSSFIILIANCCC